MFVLRSLLVWRGQLSRSRTMASKGINKAIIVGNLGGDPEVNYTGDGTAICNFSIATSESWRDKNTGEQKEKTEWHRVSIFGKLAENCGKFLHKGSKVYIEGKIETRMWEKDGHKNYTTEIKPFTVQFLDSKGAGQAPAGNSGGFPEENKPAQPAQTAEFDDDIPF